MIGGLEVRIDEKGTNGGILPGIAGLKKRHHSITMGMDIALGI